MRESQNETGLRLDEVASVAQAGSRGSSILAGILLIALTGSAAAAFEQNTFSSNIDQSAASSLAVIDDLSPLSPSDEKVTNKKSVVSDHPGVGSAKCIGRSGVVTMIPVNYACYQKGNVSKVREFVQTGPPGFEYTISERDGLIEIKPA